MGRHDYEMTNVQMQTTSKYLKPQRENKVFFWGAVTFFFTMFVLPQYFGVPFPLFDLTALRIMIVVVFLMIIADTQRMDDFIRVIIGSRFTLILIPYLFVITYTCVLRADVNAFLNPFIELFTFYLLIYLIRYSLGLERTIKMILAFSYLITLLGVLEYVMGRSPFSYLETIKGLYTGQFIRSGSYRIMSSCNHSLGYGLMLVTMVPFSCLDLEKNEVNLLKRPLLLLLLAVNVFLCGSRSTLSVFLVEVFLLVLMVSKQQKKRLILVGTLVAIAFAGWLVAFHNTAISQYILLQITSIIDEVFGTEWALNYGADPMALGSSSNYRAQLKYIFQVDWLNPFLGLGRKRSFASEINGSSIRSVDNFYIAEFVRYAYPGMIAYILFIGSFLISLFKKVCKEPSGLCKILFAGVICYMLNLIWVDSLQTLKYLYVLFALYVCMSEEQEKHPEKVSKYIKKGKIKWNH